MLKKIRIATATILFLFLTLLFLDFTGTMHLWFGWLAKIQLVPAILAMNVAVIVTLILLTLLLGRVYCSVICPLGILQDVISNISGRRKGKKNRFRYSPAKSLLRYAVLVLFIIAVATGVNLIVSILDPYAAYGRMASNFFAPLYRLGNNLLALLAERMDSYAFYSTDVWIKGWITFGIATLTLIIIGILAWRQGRIFCNTICPVGTVLGFISRYSWLKPVIDTHKCVNCNLCARNCKASCIDIKNHEIDYSRCVACMDCIGKCHKAAIRYTHPNKRLISQPTGMAEVSEEQQNDSRRNFLITTMLLATTALKAQEKKLDGGLAVIEDKKIPDRATPIVPPGGFSARNFAQHCTACQLCVSACPNGVLRPSTDLLKLLQPEMSYERGYCRPECVKCSDVCPAGAILPITVAEKSAIQIGHAVFVIENCIPLTDGVDCGNCARHCPTGAITMIASDADDSDSPKIPAVNTERCIGCGACENLCPARPFSAIYVEGSGMHREL